MIPGQEGKSSYHQDIYTKTFSVSCVDLTTAINQDDTRSGRKVILPPRYLHQNFQSVSCVDLTTAINQEGKSSYHQDIYTKTFSVSCVDLTTAINPDDTRSGRKVILPPRYLHQNFQNVSCVDLITAINQDDIRSGSKVILPPRYLHQNFHNVIAIARQYHKTDLFITYPYNPQWT